jgi:hypothetical protein
MFESEETVSGSYGQSKLSGSLPYMQRNGNNVPNAADNSEGLMPKYTYEVNMSFESRCILDMTECFYRIKPLMRMERLACYPL